MTRNETNSPPKLLPLIGALLLIIFVIDSATPLGSGVWLFYLALLLVIKRKLSAPHNLIYAALCTALIGVGFVFSPPGSPGDLAIINRAMGSVVLWLIAMSENKDKWVTSALRQSEKMYATLLESISDAFVALDKDWRYTYVNKKAAEIFGRAPEDLVDKHIWTEFPEGVGQPFRLAYERAMNEQVFIRLEEYYPPLTGGSRIAFIPRRRG